MDPRTVKEWLAFSHARIEGPLEALLTLPDEASIHGAWRDAAAQTRAFALRPRPARAAGESTITSPMVGSVLVTSLSIPITQ